MFKPLKKKRPTHHIFKLFDVKQAKTYLLEI